MRSTDLFTYLLPRQQSSQSWNITTVWNGLYVVTDYAAYASKKQPICRAASSDGLQTPAAFLSLTICVLLVFIIIFVFMVCCITRCRLVFSHFLTTMVRWFLTVWVTTEMRTFLVVELLDEYIQPYPNIRIKCWNSYVEFKKRLHLNTRYI